jgi:pimeloyl-ACP methyl ester carboxylesterase
MLASLLRRLYLFQFITGAMLGAWAAVRLTENGAGAGALIMVPLGAVLLALLLQIMVIGTSMLMSRPNDAGWLWWRAAWGESVSALQIFWFQLPWAFKPAPVLSASADFKEPARVPVLLVHGYICNHRIWDKLTRALRQAGHPVLAIDLEPLFTSIDDYASVIEQAAIQLQRASGADKIALVGHSMGGLAIRAWMRAQGTQRVAQVITLGTPHQGTQVPQWVTTPNGTQMHWHSAWLVELERSETPATRSLMQLALTPQDNIVFPQRSQTLEGAAVTEFSGLGHVQLCLNDDVIEWVLQRLT